MSEAVLTSELIKRLEKDFDVSREVKGTHLIDRAPLRIDLMAKAKPHLIQAGFTNEWFGIECKWAEDIAGTTSKMTRMVWQSITYAQSEFEINGQKIKPIFVAVYTPDNMNSSIERHLNSLLALGLYGNVGRLYFYRNGAWGIKFASIYANALNPGYHMNQSQLPKRRIGSV